MSNTSTGFIHLEVHFNIHFQELCLFRLTDCKLIWTSVFLLTSSIKINKCCKNIFLIVNRGEVLPPVCGPYYISNSHSIKNVIIRHYILSKPFSIYKSVLGHETEFLLWKRFISNRWNKNNQQMIFSGAENQQIKVSSTWSGTVTDIYEIYEKSLLPQ